MHVLDSAIYLLQVQVETARTGLAGVPGDYYDSIESQEDRVNEYDDNGYMYQP